MLGTMNYFRFIRLLSIAIISIGLIRYAPLSHKHSTLAYHLQVDTPVVIEPKPPITIIVFVHGILMVNPFYILENITAFIHQKVEKTRYAQIIEYARREPVLYENQAMQQLGLHPIILNTCKAGDAASALATVYDQMRSYASYDENPNNRYYTFGWSGLLSPTARIKAGYDLYHALEREITRLRAQGYHDIAIELISYSHGGNVCLHSAHAAGDFPMFQINNLIMLGAPITSESDHLVTSPFFKKIYSFYSTSDRAQTLDIFAPYPYKKGRRFRPHDDLQLPDNLTQVEIRMRSMLPELCGCGKSAHGCKTCSPGHTELWFFGWTEKNYRASYPHYPLPAVVFLPYIINTIEKRYNQHCANPEHELVVTLCPYEEYLTIAPSNNKKCRTLFSSISPRVIEELKEVALCYAPEESYYQRKDDTIKAVIANAKRTHYEKRKLERRLRRCGD